MPPGAKIPVSAVFVLNYAMKIEFGKGQEGGLIPAKIYLCLPDEGRSIVAGTFHLKE